MKKNLLKSKRLLKSVACAFSIFAIVSCGGNKTGHNDKETVSLSGAGATFPLPYYNMSFETFQEKTGNTISYGGIGSGSGVRNLRDEIIDFAGSDAYLSDEEMTKMKAAIHIPTCMGAVVLAYNLSGIDSLNLSGDIVADIFAGNIATWNDTRIQALNPGATLPAQNIIPVYRSDGSGTTFIFTDYLSKVSPLWAEKYGAAKSVNFPVGQAAKGNPGVAGIVSQTAGALGYVGSEYAFAQSIAYATMQNCRGELIRPTSASISAAAAGEIPSDTRTMITNADAAGAYPISCFTWIIVYKEQNYANRSLTQAQGVLDLLQYMLSPEAQKMTSEVNYAPLPQAAIDKSLANLKTITYNGEPILK